MISIDFSNLTRIERDALMFAANPDGSTTVTPEAHLTANVNALMQSAVEVFIQHKLPELRMDALKYLSLSDEQRAEVKRLLNEGQLPTETHVATDPAAVTED